MTAPEPIRPSVCAAAYSAELFEALAQQWQQGLSEHLDAVLHRDASVLNWNDPAELVQRADRMMRESSGLSGIGGPGVPATEQLSDRFRDLLSVMLSHSQNLHHPRYIGHQVPAPVPAAGLFDAVGSVTNQPMAVFEMGPWATAVEHAVIRRMLELTGWHPDESAGVLTHGGSLANLTALLTARNTAFPDCWEKGVPAGAALVAHAESHYCVARAAGILGLGTENVLRVALTEQRQMCPHDLDRVLTQAAEDGRQVFAVSACAGATPIGAFDDLNRIADVCEKHNVWLHVDAAHGGSVLLSERYRGSAAGIDRADSVIWDAHKMLFVPALCAAVLYRRKDHQFAAFRQDAPYLFDPTDPGMAEYDGGTRTPECTKRAAGFGLWGTWCLFGREALESMVDYVIDLAKWFAAELSQAGDFETLHEPECNIVVFRYRPEGFSGTPEQLGSLQQQIRSVLVRSGHSYIVQTKLDGCPVLRMVFMNPATTCDDVRTVMEEIRRIGRLLCR